MVKSAPRQKAVLAAVHLADVPQKDHDASLQELARLVQTLGFDVIAQVSQKRKAFSAGTVIGEGKLAELAAYTGGKGYVEGFKKNPAPHDEAYAEEDEVGEDENKDVNAVKADIVIFDNEISPTQMRNLEGALGVEIMDRTGVILEIFSRHARSREARMQVEIAKLSYMSPRIRASSIGGDRQGGGIGAKGSGETAHELDRRRIRDRIAELREQLEAVRAEQLTRRAHREEAHCVALVGYTNAGKSSLMRALTGSDVLVADKLFATLDTTVRALYPETNPRILISDTVGFIQKLPHDLVASFRSTLDEAHAASLLLFTVDASDPTFREQLEVTRKALSEIGVSEIPSRIVLNKIDRLDDLQLAGLRRAFPDAIMISALNPEDVKKLHGIIVSFFESKNQEELFLIPYDKTKLIGEIRKVARVVSEQYENENIKLVVSASKNVLDGIRKKLS